MRILKRGPAACNYCRGRKIRCNVSTQHPRCSNCTFRGYECVVVKRPRGKLPSPRAPSQARPTNSTKGKPANNNTCEGINHEPALLVIYDDAWWRSQEHAPFQHDAPLLLEDRALRREAMLPDFIAPVTFGTQHKGTEALLAKAFILPDKSLRNELLKCFVQFVHPFLPVLDLHYFLQAINQNPSPHSRISILVFQAVMLAAIPYVDMQLLASRGFASRKEARSVFHERSNLLYTSEIEKDPILVSQAALIMMTSEEPKRAWHLLRDSISRVQEAGYHVFPASSGLNKRLWWTCYVRDRIQSTSMGVPLLINGDDFAIGILSLDDMEIKPLSFTLLHMLGMRASDVADSLYLAQAYVELVRCCRAISSILVYRVPPNITQLEPKTTDRAAVLHCDIALESWFRDLPQQVTWADWTTRDYLNNTCSKSLRVQRALLTGLYLSFHSTLHCPQMGTVAEERNAELRKFSEARITRSALLISEIVHDLHRYGDIPCLSELAVPVLAPAIEAHLANRGSICPSNRSQSQYHLQSCIQVLQQLQEMHPSADASYRRLQDSLGQDALGLFSIPSQPSPIAVQVEGGELQTRKGHPCGLQSHDPSSQGADAVSLAFSKPAAAAAYILDRATTTDWEKKLIASLADATGTRATVTYSPETNDVWSRPISGARLRGSTSHLPCSNLDFTMNSVPPDYRVYPASTSPLNYSVDGGPQSWTWELWCQRLGTMMCDSEAQLRSILDPVLPLETGVTTTSQDM